MNRENKRKQYEKGYYKTHPCRDSFTCRVCGRLASPQGAGSEHRNHCPNCLTSLHMDMEPGDRASDCGGIMEPIAVWVRKGGEWAVIHRCRRCGALSSNRVAADDNPRKLVSIAMKPVACQLFPIERLEELARSFAARRFFCQKGGAQPPSAGLFQEQLAGMAGMSRQEGTGQAAPDVDNKAS